ncbi:MBL fold metallo-hydrolase [Chitinophaga rhizosphaerae]|uniref:MBL fold metallo-hydrolase n=1 Tax=Chitinophaga rhizosphaerae TaxID=1864947 RepID=UPI000F811FEA|nr:MBL fold metallo-hydrolase [Chitinophaga rhizosphaerae]
MEWNSPNFRNGTFHNQLPTELMSADNTLLKVFIKFMRKPKSVNPPGPLPSVCRDLKTPPGPQTRLTWFGHSSYLVQMNGLNILVDPVFSSHASPVPIFAKAFAGSNVYGPADMPDIDILIITHNHYDHLDSRTIRALRHRVGAVCTGLGVKPDLIRHGLPADIITELDWGQCAQLPAGLQLTAAPARHFSGRGVKRNQSLWSSYILASGQEKIYIGGDSGYGPHFKTIGDANGPFDLAILETGQYNTDWANIHMMPEEAIQAGTDLRAKAILPVHWAKFSLAFHPWDEPVRRVLAEAQKTGMPVATPMIGEAVVLHQPLPASRWWESVKQP